MRAVLANHSSAPGAADDLAGVLREQVALGLDLVTDGQLGWDDTIAPLLAGLGGVRLGPVTTLPGLARPYRQPIVEAKLRRHRSLCVDAYRRAAALTEAPIKVVCTGPHTLAHAAGLATTAYRSADHLAEARQRHGAALHVHHQGRDQFWAAHRAAVEEAMARDPRVTVPQIGADGVLRYVRPA